MEAYLHAILLGLLEAGTEFLPVSSTGHLLLAGHFLGFDSPNRVFEVVIQLGAVLAIVVLYFERLWGVATGLLRRDPMAVRFTLAVLAGFAPALVLGAGLYGFIKAHAFNPWLVCVMLIAGGVVILVLERRMVASDAISRIHAVDELPLATALKIGLFQCLALVPGVSRSGASIMGGLALGLDRKTAAEFSFFLALPTMVAAVSFDLFKNRHVLDGHDLSLMAVGLVTAFMAALLVVKWLMGFVTRHGFGIFGWYRIAMGSAGLLALLIWG